MLGNEAVSFYCDTTHTRNGFCHHVYTCGLGKKNEHTRLSYLNRTWDTFVYETAIYSAIAKFPKRFRADLRKEVEKIGQKKSEACKRDLEKFERAFNSLSPEKKAAVQKYTPEVTNKVQFDIVTNAVQMFAHL